MLFKGAGVAIITPFTQDHEIDFEALGQLIDYQIDEGIDVIVSVGTTGESVVLTESEKLDVIKYTIDRVDGRVPVMAGTGSNNTREAVEFSKKVSQLDVDSLLVVSPYYNKGTNEGLIEHYTQIADVSEKPVMLYTVPGRTGHNIPVEVVVELSKHDNIFGIKDASGDLAYTMDIRRQTPEDFQIVSGNDDQIVPMLSVGAQGVISVIANVFPKETSQMVHEFLNGNVEASKDLQLKMIPFVKAMFSEVSPVPVKYATHLLGFGTPELRLPLTTAQLETQAQVKKALEDLGRL
ncbi:4-hydroxy-tetrahydrodipicolinate synthase [Dolosicoccus paucivorans]|uniref:4-hydroxy-tetrahydrodipicolinate synthase n=1 Tax=Dolosicoccus paucivorans TaxID=84521 RepID=A0A2N6SLK9_9LACT|nr:4-hydroxy-tetrahydrodipicolinate synthase [Dolosicoccus paucivorans]PMB83835.1 4-hydroxy-tetrahydrodipicolinate synthase [Dolosicoccus paucivorans]PMC57968.1 4-hydroxy-tetrahydrodipicolinate synthase [Dolosicoccus paucivorans]